MNKTIKTKVTAQGVLIPRQLLEGIEEVEIKTENDVITIMPTEQMNSNGSRSQLDPIWNLGENPVECGISDASEQHDKYLYGAYRLSSYQR